MLKLNTIHTRYTSCINQFTVNRKAIEVISQYIDIQVIELTSHITGTTKVFNKISEGLYMSPDMAFSIKIV